MHMDNPRYINREMSWLEFNARVLDEAADEGTPLLERLKFIAIFSSNLDEFFMVRVAGINKQIESGATKFAHGYNPKKTLKMLDRRVRTLVSRQYRYLEEDIRPALADAGIVICAYSDLNPSQKDKLKKSFQKNIFPVLTPVAIDQSHPFPVIKNGAVELLVSLEPEQGGKERYAIIEVPEILPRFIPVENTGQRVVLLPVEALIAAHLEMLLPGCEIQECGMFRITRDMDISIDEESVADLLSEIQVEMQKKGRREVIRLELAKGLSPKARRWLEKKLDVTPQMIHGINGLLNLKRLLEITSLPGFANLRDQELPPLSSTQLDPEKSIFDNIRNEGAIVLHHPYESFTPVIRFLEEAANDPGVLAIKQTLYRVSGDSPIVRALIQAARNGKQVTVLIELRARFDEENNILWARELAEAGAHVVYGQLPV